MSPNLALFLCILFIGWFFLRESRLSLGSLGALWLPLVWIVIVGSRPVSRWFGTGLVVNTIDDYLKGSPLDRNLSLCLLVLGLMVLLRRRLAWTEIWKSNRWLFAFFLYWAISILWSDYPLLSFKRWIKDIGNIVMVLIVLTDKASGQATKAIFARYTYIVILLSAIFIKYFPEFGRTYSRWTGEPAYVGVTSGKNALGSIAFICGLFLIWRFIEMKSRRGGRPRMVDIFGHLVLLCVVFWLLGKASSSTSIICFVLGIAIILFMQFDIAKAQVRYLGAYSILIVCLIFFLYSITGLTESLVGMFGKDMSLTGRTALWTDLLSAPINPFFGTGYQSFWMGTTAHSMWEKYYFHPNQAHNGYLETYLNGGLLGLALLMATIASAFRNLKNELLLGNSFGVLRFAFLVTAVFSNWTEATFNRQSLVWIIFLFSVLRYRRKMPHRGRGRQRALV